MYGNKLKNFLNIFFVSVFEVNDENSRNRIQINYSEARIRIRTKMLQFRNIAWRNHWWKLQILSTLNILI